MGSMVWSKGCSVAGLVQEIMQNSSWRQLYIYRWMLEMPWKNLQINLFDKVRETE